MLVAPGKFTLSPSSSCFFAVFSRVEMSSSELSDGWRSFGGFVEPPPLDNRFRRLRMVLEISVATTGLFCVTKTICDISKW